MKDKELYNVNGHRITYTGDLKIGPELHSVMRVASPYGGLFQQDNAPAHASRATKEYLEHHAVGVFPWPSTSPDMNPIENVYFCLA